MADVISDLKQQMNILAPAISGIVVGVTSMIISIMNELSGILEGLPQLNPTQSGNPAGNFLQQFGDSIPPYYFQIIIGVYLVQVIYIMSILINDIEFGSDKLSEKYLIGSNLIQSTIVYIIIAIIITAVFTFLAQSIIGSISIGQFSSPV